MLTVYCNMYGFFKLPKPRMYNWMNILIFRVNAMTLTVLKLYLIWVRYVCRWYYTGKLSIENKTLLSYVASDKELKIQSLWHKVNVSSLHYAAPHRGMYLRGAVVSKDGERTVCEHFLNRCSKRRKYQHYNLKRKRVNKKFCLWPSALLSPLFLSEEAAGRGGG